MRLVRRYGEGIFLALQAELGEHAQGMLAQEGPQALEKVFLSPLREWSSLERSSETVRAVFNSPRIAREVKVALFSDFCRARKWSDFFRRVGALCITRHRRHEFLSVGPWIRDRALELQGATAVKVESAHALESKEEVVLKKGLEKALGPLVPEYRVNPDIGAGVKISVPGKSWEASVRSMFMTLESQLQSDLHLLVQQSQ